MSFNFKLPQIQGTDPSVQISSMQTYLYQLVEQLNHTINALDKNITETTEKVIASQDTSKEKKEKESQDNFDEIKGLIIKSADIVKSYYEKMKLRFSGEYLAGGDFGTFVESTVTDIEISNEGVTTLVRRDEKTSVDGIVNERTIISKINQSAEEVNISANKIALEGYTTINDGFSVDLNGNVTANDAVMHNATIDGDILFPNSTSKIVGGQGLYSTLTFTSKKGRYCVYDTGYEEPLDISPYKDYVYIDAYIPPNFVITSAHVTLVHQPHSASGMWFGVGTGAPYTNVVGYARSIAMYKVTNAGREEYTENTGDYQPTEPSGTEITSAFGSSGWTPSNTSNISMISTSDIASSIGLTVGENNRFVFMTKQTRPSESTTITQFKNNIVATHSNLEAILTVNGYTSV